MIRRVTRRSRRGRLEPSTGAALEGRIEVWPFLLAAGLAVGLMTAVELRLDAGPQPGALSTSQPASAPHVPDRVAAEPR